jgi:hypothetical protein
MTSGPKRAVSGRNGPPPVNRIIPDKFVAAYKGASTFRQRSEVIWARFFEMWFFARIC